MGSSVPLCHIFCLGKWRLRMRMTSKLVIRAGLSTARNIPFQLGIEEFQMNIINQGDNTKGIYKFTNSQIFKTILAFPNTRITNIRVNQSSSKFIWFPRQKRYIGSVLYFLEQKNMSKKSLILIAGLSCLFLVGCGTKTAPTNTIDTWMLFSWEQGLTWTQSGEILSGQNTTMREELTGETQTGSLVITGQQATTTNKSSTWTVSATTGKALSAEVSDIIKTRATKPKDDNKLTEDDIDLIDQVIQKIENLWK